MARQVSLGLVCGLVVFGFMGGSAGASVSSSSGPWWFFSGGTRPGSVVPGSAHNEVQEIVTTPEEFEGNPEQTNFVLKVSGGPVGEGEFASEPVAGMFGLTVLSAANLQKVLEKPDVYGAGNVRVEETPVENPVVGGEKRFLVTTIGEDADRGVARLEFLPEIGAVNGHKPGEEQPIALSKVLTLARGDGEIVVNVENVGDQSVDGSVVPVVLKDVLPPGLRAVSVIANAPKPKGVNIGGRDPVPCSLATLSCTWEGGLAAYDNFEFRVSVVAEPGAVSGSVNEVRASGGGAPAASLRRGIAVGAAPGFGVGEFRLAAEEEGGGLDRQAGSHPFQLTTAVTLNQTAEGSSSTDPEAEPVELPKDVNTLLPPGLLGNTLSVPRCTLRQFLTLNADATENLCSADTAIGVSTATVNEPVTFKTLAFTMPVFNLEPARGEPARFGFYVRAGNVPIVLDTAVRSGGDYGVTVSSSGISQAAGLLSAVVTLWGVPGDARHDSSRGWGCLALAREAQTESPCNHLEAHQPPPFLSLPSSCTGPLQASVETDPWAHPGQFSTATAIEPLPALDGCNQLPFDASIKLAPETSAASTPTGLNVDLHFPQEESFNAQALAPAPAKDITVALPEGVSVNPSSANGLMACSEAQAGYLPGTSSPPGELHFTPDAAFCPDAAKIATVQVKTPLLANPLEGGVYLAAQNANPFGSLIAMYILAEDPVSGVRVKLAGDVSLDPNTGRITATVRNNPQTPFEDALLHFFGGEHAAVATPSHCGTYTTEASFTPWSGNPPIGVSSQFQVTSGAHGAPCPPTPATFTPALQAGSINNQAGAFSVFSTTITRADTDQELKTVSLRLAPGLLAILSSVTPCPEPQAALATCPSQSLIGHATANAGIGSSPFTVTGGQVFLTGPYKGAPFGLAILTPAKAGPLDLGNVIVRARLDVDPHTAQAIVTTDPLPRILDGIPLDLQQVNVTIDKPGFMFNPTNCSALAINGSIEGTAGAVSPVSQRYQAANCANLQFAPKVTVTTSGRPTKAKGASLIFKLVYPQSPHSSQANIAKVKAALPKQLPSRLTTLQKACLATVFNQNPASCPPGSIVGHAKLTTPILPVPLTGPAYFVSHGGAAFPDLTIVLQGDNVTIQLVGNTNIHNGITTSTFNTTPDAPFNTFELTLPQGPNSALSAYGNLCTTHLHLPITITAQNNQTKTQTTTIKPTNCPKKHHNTKHRKH